MLFIKKKKKKKKKKKDSTKSLIIWNLLNLLLWVNILFKIIKNYTISKYFLKKIDFNML